MPSSVVAVMTGFTKSPVLLQRSLAPLCNLKRAGKIQRILCVTWDRSDIDAYVDPIAALPDVELLRVPQPDVSGTAMKIGVTCQIRNLETALACVAQDDALIVKIRPDFVADEEFLESKIVDFDRLCAPSNLAQEFGVTMPPSPFAAKIWIPWADANLPLHYEDAAFIGLKCDIAKLANRDTEQLLNSNVLSDKTYGWFSHVARYATVFSPAYPLFDNYVKNFRFFVHDMDYRLAMMPAAVKETFFWRLIVANAWILATNFHVDCGAPGQLAFYPNSKNRDADWSSVRSLKIHQPYGSVAEWRAAQAPGSMLQGVGRVLARLVDDSWQHALFTHSKLADLTPDNLRGALQRVARYRHDVPDMGEESLYRVLDGIYRVHCESRAIGESASASG